MFQDDLDNADNLVAHLGKRACWDQHRQERITSLFPIADRCLEAWRKKRPEVVELIPELGCASTGFTLHGFLPLSVDDGGDAGPSGY